MLGPIRLVVVEEAPTVGWVPLTSGCNRDQTGVQEHRAKVIVRPLNP